MTKEAIGRLMEIIVLGSGTAIPAIGRSPAGYLIRGGDTDIVLDMGSGTLSRLHTIGKSYREIDNIFISHFHSDHVLDLIMLLQANNATPGWTRVTTLRIMGCSGLKKFIDSVFLLFDGTVPENYQLDIVELGPGRHSFPGFQLEAALTRHTSNSLAIRLEIEDRIIVYTGDAVECDELITLARQANILICECSFLAGFETTDHFSADGCGRLAHKADAKRLILTHLYPETDDETALLQAQNQFKGEIIVARDNLVLDT